MAAQIHKPRDPDLDLKFRSIADAFYNGLMPDERRLLGAANLSETTYLARRSRSRLEA